MKLQGYFTACTALFFVTHYIVCAEDAQPKVDVTPYLPKDVEKRGPYVNRRAEDTFFEYFEKQSNKLLAKEFVFKGKTVRLNFVKAVTIDGMSDMVKDGIQREWHENGQLKSESPYTAGVMNGVFKEWDEKGNLIARNKILNGTGLLRVYFSNGQLKEEINFIKNKQEPPFYGFFENGQLKHISSYEEVVEKKRGFSFCFMADGTLRFCGYSLKGTSIDFKLNGPSIDFKNNKATTVQYFLNGQKVSEEKYALASENNDALPKYEKDSDNYAKNFSDKIKTLKEKYGKPPVVTIPLKDED